MAVAMCLAMPSCGSSDEPDNPGEAPTEDEDTVEITRPQDGDGKVFLENGIIVDATTNITNADITKALADTTWELSYYIVYNNSSVSDTAHASGQIVNYVLPILLYPDKIAYFGNLDKRSYSVRGKTLIISPNYWSSVWIENVYYTVVSIDYTDSLRRIILDFTTAQMALPEGFTLGESRARLVFFPVQATN